jgi:hypothetical protein
VSSPFEQGPRSTGFLERGDELVARAVMENCLAAKDKSFVIL